MPDQPDNAWTTMVEDVLLYDAKAAEYRRAQQLSKARRNMARTLTRRG